MRRLPSLPRAQGVFLIAGGIPLLFYFSQVNSFGRLEYDDYYGILPQVTHAGHFATNPLSWLLVKSNEHTVTLPALIFAADAKITSGDNRVLSMLSIALLFVLLLLLCFSLPRAFADSTDLTVAGTLLLGGLVFSPAGSYSVVMGFSGIMWFLSLVSAVLAIVLLRRCAGNGSWLPVGVVLLAGLGCALSFSTSVFLWPALLVGVLIYRVRWTRVVALCLGALAVYAFAAATYVRLSQHPTPGLRDLRRIIEFVGVYLGSLFSGNPWVAGALGLVGLALGGLVAVLFSPMLLQRAAEDLAPWVMLTVFGAANALGAAIARASLGGARSSRYAPVAAMFWIGLLVLVLDLGYLKVKGNSGARRMVRILPVLLVVPPVVATWCRGLPVLRGWLERASWQPVAELALAYEIPDWEVLEAVSIAPQQVMSQRGLLSDLRHVPFSQLPAFHLGAHPQANDLKTEASATTHASVTAAVPVIGGVARVEGMLVGEVPADGELLILDAGDGYRGLARVLDQPSFLERLGLKHRQAARWAGYVLPSAPDDALCVFSHLDDDQRTLRPISGTWRVLDTPQESSSPSLWRRELGLLEPWQ